MCSCWSELSEPWPDLRGVFDPMVTADVSGTCLYGLDADTFKLTRWRRCWAPRGVVEAEPVSP